MLELIAESANIDSISRPTVKASVIKIMTKLYSNTKTMQQITLKKPPNLVHILFLVEECHKLKADFWQ